MTAKRQPLAGVRIADFTWIGAGSYTTKILADLGADIIKIESSVHPDSLRLSAPFKNGVKGIDNSGYFADRNTSKRSVTLNLKHPEGVKLARRIIAESAVVANNFTPGTMEKLGLSYETLSADREDLIYLEMSTHGRDGPEAHVVGYGLTIGAMTGLQALSGLPDRDPAGTGTNYPDHIPNPGHAAFALIAALRHRRRTGKGQRIDIAQTEPTIAMMAPAFLRQSANGVATQRSGNREAGAAPHGVYPCRGEDRWIAIAVRRDSEWQALCAELGDPALDRAEWQSAAGREGDQDRLDAALAAATRQREAEPLMQALEALGVAAGVVQTSADVLERDPQLAHRGHWRRLHHGVMGEITFNGLPFRFASGETGPFRPSPLIGEHTEEICRDLLRLSEGEIAALSESGVLK